MYLLLPLIFVFGNKSVILSFLPCPPERWRKSSVAQSDMWKWPILERPPHLQKSPGHSSLAEKQNLPLSNLMRLQPHPVWGMTGGGVTPSRGA